MTLRQLRKTKPRPKFYHIGVSIRVPEYEGYEGMPMDTVRLNIIGSCQSGSPHHKVCMDRISRARDEYLRSEHHAAAIRARGTP